MTNADSEVQTDAPSLPKGKLGNDHNIGKRQKVDGNSGVARNGGKQDKHCDAAVSTPVLDRDGSKEDQTIIEGRKGAKKC